MTPYLDLARRIVDEGVWVENERTGESCKTVINANMTYDVSNGDLIIDTARKVAWKPAVAEVLGYLKGYTSAAQFRELGCKTWDANANKNEAWLKNPARTGTDDLGRVYGAHLKWRRPDGTTFDQLKKVVDNLSRGIDDRGEIITFYNPGEFNIGCLRPCMHTHQFSLLGNQLFLNSTQRSADVPLGLAFNQVQVTVLIRLFAQITGTVAAEAYHQITNAHIYAPQYELMRDVHLSREPFSFPKLSINPDIKTVEDIRSWVSVDDFSVEGYESHPPIVYPFSV
jgi:thymidylate synthase